MLCPMTSCRLQTTARLNRTASRHCWVCASSSSVYNECGERRRRCDQFSPPMMELSGLPQRPTIEEEFPEGLVDIGPSQPGFPIRPAFQMRSRMTPERLTAIQIEKPYHQAKPCHHLLPSRPRWHHPHECPSDKVPLTGHRPNAFRVNVMKPFFSFSNFAV